MITLSPVFQQTRQEQQLSYRKLAAALGCSHQQAKNYCTRGHRPELKRVESWMDSPLPWLRDLGYRVFGILYRPLVRAIADQLDEAAQ